jgi:hypothetical protein
MVFDDVKPIDDKLLKETASCCPNNHLQSESAEWLIDLRPETGFQKSPLKFRRPGRQLY